MSCVYVKQLLFADRNLKIVKGLISTCLLVAFNLHSQHLLDLINNDYLFGKLHGSTYIYAYRSWLRCSCI